MTDRISEETMVSQLTRAMDGVEQARLGLLEAAKALDEFGADRILHRDVVMAMDECRDFQARLTEFVADEDSHR
jgi:hypothetical protein